MSNEKIIVVVPTFNERENIEPLIEQILKQPLNLELIVVDDNSPDGTGEILDRLAHEDPRIHVVHRMNERGRASAGIAGFKTALAQSDAEFIVEMDADFSHNPDDLPALVRAAESADVAIGSRYVPHGGQKNCLPRNILFSRIINWVNRYLLKVDAKDSSGGFKCYRRKVLETINLDDYVAREFSVGVETLLKCQKYGFKFHEIPIIFINRRAGRSKADPGVLIEYPISVVKLWIRSIQGKID